MKSRFFWIVFLAGALCSSTQTVSAFQSGDKRLIYESTEKPVPLVELYTSDARSSCNKAVEFFNAYKTKDPKTELWKRFVPIVMHVNLWDIKGYKDAFSKKEFAERLQVYQKSWGVRQVYAPTVAVNGLEWSGWARGQDVPLPPFERAGILRVDGSQKEDVFDVQFAPEKGLAGKTFVVHASLLGFGLRSKPSEGSNRGHALQHEFVAIYLRQAELKPKDGLLIASLELPRKGLRMKEYAVVFWVSEPGKNAAIQSTGGYLPI